MISLIEPQNNATVTLLKQKHLDYIRNPQSFPTAKIDWLNLMETQEDQSFPEPLRFAFSPRVDGEIVLIRQNGERRVYPAVAGEAYLSNLLIDEDYRWYARIGEECSELFRFHTDPQAPRMLRVDGISNVRDFGGFATEQGGRVRQGLIYRTSEMDTHVQITEQGKQTLEQELGIRLDVDIRGIKNEPRGPILNEARVKWVNFPLAAYADCFSEEQKKLYGESYALLAREESYPLMIHCWGGIDRTGTWLYILGGMLGVSKNDLDLDYELSSFSRWGRRSRSSDQFMEFLRELYRYGNSLQEACASFMRACGVTEEQLERIRRILLEEPK
ncbi:MAG: tyrosine-protein phosphatase [Ruminococcaceae bacterium]|nr:tyrosine-protein phosphatase [Oscillospiraceae bacterium]